MGILGNCSGCKHWEKNSNEHPCRDCKGTGSSDVSMFEEKEVAHAPGHEMYLAKARSVSKSLLELSETMGDHFYQGQATINYLLSEIERLEKLKDVKPLELEKY